MNLEIDQAEPVVLALGGVGAVVLAWAVTPPLLHWLGLSRYRAIVEDGPHEEEYGQEDPLDLPMHRLLHAMKFKPLGAVRERVRFFVMHWVWSVRHRVFAGLEAQAYACVYRFAPGEPARVAFATCFDDGAMIWTTNSAQAAIKEADDYVHQCLITTDLAELLVKHHEAVARFKAAGRTSARPDRLAPLTSGLEKFGQRYLSTDRSSAWSVLALYGSCLIALFFVFATSGKKQLEITATSLALWLASGAVCIFIARYILMWLARGSGARKAQLQSGDAGEQETARRE